MNEIYDILVNWNTNLFEFYEWNSNDEITHIRKVPIMKVTSQVLRDLFSKKVIVSKEFLNKIFHKCEYYSKKRKEQNYVSLFSDGKTVLAVQFDEEGKSILKSRLLLDEEEEILELAVRMKEDDFSYKILESEKQRTQTRYELELELYLKKELFELQKKENLSKLEYLFYDCYDAKERSREEMLLRLRNDLLNHKTKVIKKMEEFFKKTSFNK